MAARSQASRADRDGRGAAAAGPGPSGEPAPPAPGPNAEPGAPAPLPDDGAWAPDAAERQVAEAASPGGRARERPPAALTAAGQGAIAATEGPLRSAARRGWISSLTVRILAINVLALAILFGGLLYLGQYRSGLIEAKVASLSGEARIIAGALGESAIAGAPADPVLDVELARQMVGRLVVSGRARARVFARDGALIVDSRELAAAGREVQSAVLPPPGEVSAPVRAVRRAYDWIVARLPQDVGLPLYNEAPDQRAEDYREVAGALAGRAGSALRVGGDGRLVISVAFPVQHFKKVLGALMLSAGSADIGHSVRQVRLAIVQVFMLALAITVLLSLFLAGTIARPVRRLAQAARRVRQGHAHRVEIPDFTRRRDEIGELSGALSDMTEALYQRLDAIERFAADVAHELKNPLTSMRSAVESLPHVKNPEQEARLIEIIRDDVTRMNRLITDISEASRLDAELSRAETVPVDIGHLLTTTAEIYRATAGAASPALELAIAESDALVVDGIEDRLGQVVTNLLANTVSFSPPGGGIRLGAARQGAEVVFSVEDQGPGIPERDLEAVFERFYTLRPEGEAFGTHSGLGLSISRQIVEAHGGTIRAENARDALGRVVGARFVVRLPA